MAYIIQWAINYSLYYLSSAHLDTGLQSLRIQFLRCKHFISLVAWLCLYHKNHLLGTSHGSNIALGALGLLPTLTHLFWTILDHQLERRGLVSHSADRKRRHRPVTSPGQVHRSWEATHLELGLISLCSGASPLIPFGDPFLTSV